MDFKFDKSYPTEFSYMEDLVREAQKQLIHMNQGMYHFPDKGVRSAFDKPNEGEWRFGKRNHLLSALQYAQSAYRNRIFEWVEKELERQGADPKIAYWVKGSVSSDLTIHYSEAQEATRAQMLNRATRVEEKVSIEDSSRVNVSSSGIKEPEKPTKPDRMLPSMSSRFSQSLSYTRASQKTAKATEKSPEPSISIEPIKD